KLAASPAFVREFGCTPGEYRERVRQLAP
ncbi:hypothetical protein ACUWFH_18670, partial [Escherichia coli]